MLFYETEGEFGDENFKVTAKSLFPLDIGTATYTEYDPADPEVIKFLMSNPEALMLKKGHIHSHNNMGVFFSGTDNEELVDNCGFHNFYLSLIVNNKNEMCAKIAFKAKTTSENHLTINFLNQEGKERQKKITNKNENECVYVYKCLVIKQQEAVEDTFKSRFQELKEAKELKEKAKRVSEAATKDKQFSAYSGGVDARWRQSGLFDDVKGSTYVPKGERGLKREVAADLDRRATIENLGSGAKGGSVVERVGNSKTDPRVYSMLTKILSLDFLYEGSLTAILKKMNDEFYPGEEDYDKSYDPYQPHLYYDAVETRAVDFYIDSFPEDSRKLMFFEPTMNRCVEILETYEDQYPELITNLTESLNLEIR